MLDIMNSYKCIACGRTIKEHLVVMKNGRPFCPSCSQEGGYSNSRYGGNAGYSQQASQPYPFYEAYKNESEVQNVNSTYYSGSTDKWRPSSIKAYLDRYVIGQDRAKKVLAVAAHEHFIRVERLNDPTIKKSNVFLIGPSGCGKTYLMQTLAKYLDLPLAICPATSLTEAGWVGDDVESIILALYQASGKDITRCQKGIVFIDEIDKLAPGSNPGSRSSKSELGGVGVQQALLPIIEGTRVTIRPGGRLDPMPVEIDTTNILFVCGGAFPELENIVRKRMSGREKAVGFMAKYEDENEVPTENILTYAKNEDLREFGFIPEFIGRVPLLTFLNDLTVDDLVRICSTAENSVIKQYQKLLKADNINLQFDHDALVAISERAIGEGTGARGLRKIIEDLLLEIRYSAPDLCAESHSVTSYRVTRANVEGTEPLVPGTVEGFYHQSYVFN